MIENINSSSQPDYGLLIDSVLTSILILTKVSSLASGQDWAKMVGK